MSVDRVQFSEIRRLLAMDCYSHRAIARLVCCDRRYVNEISRGNYRGVVGWRQKKSGDQWPGENGKVGRCRGCGAQVQLPCLSCRRKGVVDLEGRPL